MPFRVGRYAEALMGAGLANLPGHALLASQLPVVEDGKSVGEFDFLLQAPDVLYHIELAMKVYIALPVADGLCYVGPGLRDALDLKLAHLCDHQLKLSQQPAARALLPPGVAVQPVAWLRGWTFYRDPATPAAPGLHVDHLRGWWRNWGEDLPRARPDSLWRCLGKPEWLAPRVADAAALPFSQWLVEVNRHFAECDHPIVVAEYAPHVLGGQELARGMLVSADWPDRILLGKLQAQIARRYDRARQVR